MPKRIGTLSEYGTGDQLAIAAPVIVGPDAPHQGPHVAVDMEQLDRQSGRWLAGRRVEDMGRQATAFGFRRFCH
jgi:hypothetical protein